MDAYLEEFGSAGILKAAEGGDAAKVAKLWRKDASLHTATNEVGA